MMPPPPAGDDHITGLGEPFPEELCHLVHRIARKGARRAEDRDLADIPVGAEDLGREPHLLERRVHELEVRALVGLLPGLERGEDHFADVFRPPDALGGLHQFLDDLVYGAVVFGEMNFHGFPVIVLVSA
jgi:hypothetical protein